MIDFYEDKDLEVAKDIYEANTSAYKVIIAIELIPKTISETPFPLRIESTKL